MVQFNSDAKTEDDIQGNERPLPGRYHVVIKDVKFEAKVTGDNGFDEWVEVVEDQCTRIAFTLEVASGTTPGQEDRSMVERFFLTEKALPRLERFARACGLLKGPGPQNVEFANATGHQLVVEVEKNSFKNQKGEEVETVRVSYMGMWSQGNKEVADVPKNEEAAKLAGTSQQTEQTEQVASQQSEPAAAGNAVNDKWANL